MLTTKGSKALLYIGGIHLTHNSPSWHKEKSWWRQMLSSCLVPARLTVPTFTFPAIETLTGYLFVFNTVGELPTGEQQTSLWTLTWSWLPLHLQTAWAPSQLCCSDSSAPLLQAECDCSMVHSVFPSDLQAPPKPCWKLWWKEVKTSTCPEMSQGKESLSK